MHWPGELIHWYQQAYLDLGVGEGGLGVAQTTSMRYGTGRKSRGLNTWTLRYCKMRVNRFMDKRSIVDTALSVQYTFDMFVHGICNGLSWPDAYNPRNNTLVQCSATFTLKEIAGD